MLRLCAIAMLSLACDPKADGGPQVCDPFVADRHPSKLRELFVAGRAADGGLYVVDHTWYKDRAIDPRLFVSDGDALRRVRTDGHVDDGEPVWTFPVSAHAPPFTLVVTDEAGVRRMGLLVGAVQHEPFAIGEVGEELAPVDEGAIAGRAIYNFAAPVAFEYAARATDGRTIVVLGPDPSEDYDHYRLFLGIDELVEHEVLSFLRQQDGGTTEITFTSDDGEGVALFPTPFYPERSPTLTIDGTAVDLTTIDPVTLDDAIYRCR